jgi:hypothetical protein
MSDTIVSIISLVSISITLVLLGVIIADRRWRADILSIFRQQQMANIELMLANEKLSKQVAVIQEKLDLVTAELKEVRRQLEIMTKRAMVAEERVDDG